MKITSKKMKNQFWVIELYIMEESKTDIYNLMHRLTSKSKMIATISKLMQILVTRKHYQNTGCGEGTCASAGGDNTLLHAQREGWRRMLGVWLFPLSLKTGSLTETGARLVAGKPPCASYPTE